MQVQVCGGGGEGGRGGGAIPKRVGVNLADDDKMMIQNLHSWTKPLTPFRRILQSY